MGGNSKKRGIAVLIVVVILIAAAAGIYLSLFKNKAKTELGKVAVTPTGPVRGEIGFVEPTSTVKIGTKEVSKGNFQKIESGVIYYQEGGEVASLPLTTDEIAVNCTDQSLDTATELDYTKIKSVKIYSSKTIVGKIPENEPIVVFAAMVKNTLTAHTIALATASCPK